MTSDNPIPSRSYTCYSPLCEGGVKGLDRVPKPYGEAALCWACGSDLYTVPRFGASEEAVKQRPGMTPILLKTGFVPPGPGGYNWMQAFSGLIIRPPAQEPSSQ